MGSKWIELNMEIKPRNAEDFKAVLVGLVRPLVEEFKRLVPGERSWHYLWENKPWSYTLRLRFYGPEEQVGGFRVLLEERLRSFGSEHPDLVGIRCYGRHGECGQVYDGEVDSYGENGWRLVMKMLEFGAEAALELIANSRIYKDRLISSESDVPWVYADRYVHLFLNQLSPFVDEVRFYLTQAMCRLAARVCGRSPKDWLAQTVNGL